jgi:hypothetical protein
MYLPYQLMRSAPAGTPVIIDFKEGIKFFIRWINCPDNDPILCGWIGSFEDAKRIIEMHSWNLINIIK